MKDGPQVSVVMCVYNGARFLEESINSILGQSFRQLEFIIVDDGSTDDTPRILAEFSRRDHRVRVISQQNTGLTRALNRGCQEATAPVIARQDVGDISLPTRLERQVNYLSENPEVVAVGVGARRLGPGGEFLGTMLRDLSPGQVTHAFLTEGTGLLHPAAAFRTDAFVQVGGYRPEFRFAQDTDLWYRLSTVGSLAEVPAVLFSLRVELQGISARQTNRQIALADLARRCYLLRKSGQSESELLEQAAQISNGGQPGDTPAPPDSNSEGDAAYFLGSQLLTYRDPRCRKYLANAIMHRRRPAAAAFKLVVSLFVCSSSRAAEKSAADRID